jgi:hypothetical protein
LSGDISQVHPTEDAAAQPVGGANEAAAMGLAALLTSHVLRDGEIVVLILKPSLWFIPLQSIFFSSIVAIFAAALALADRNVIFHNRTYSEAAGLLIAGRLMWSSLQWMGRLYVLTDQRILRLSGVYTTEIFDCLLRKVAMARLMMTTRDQILGIGSVVIFPADEKRPPAVWQTVGRPKEVHQRIMAAIARAKM